MILDGHIHIRDGKEDREDFSRKLRSASVDGGIVVSLPPAAFETVAHSLPPAKRLDNLFFWCESGPNLYPFYWVDPLADDALGQVAMATKRGVVGFKVICDRYYPRHDRAMEVFKAIAQANRPILFHSGILWDGKPSSDYNRPGQFEALLEVDGLRFCLAHMSWPWCDELIAVYGKFQNAHTRRPDLSVEMFTDTTPGTPPVYRHDVLARLFKSEYDVEHHVIFGTDCYVNDYNVQWARGWISRDKDIFNQLGLSKEATDGVFAENLKRFVGVSTAKIERKPPKPAQ